ncbi:MAG TPA: 4Fe-4S binding protein, partial [Synergistetes bacterium]|nr:4Fe-4S binding protein [Synergistota bacterium]
LGEWTSRLGARLGIRKREFPEKMDKTLRWLKYGVLILIIAATWRAGTLVWRSYDPWVAWMHLSAGWEEFLESPWSYFSLFVLVIGMSLFIERFWCRYLCPLGALLAPLQKIGLVKVRRSEDDCINCHRCGTVCPVRLDPEKKDVENSAECIACGRCVEACPKEKALFFGTSKKKLAVLTVGIATLAIFLGGYGIARGTGYWQTYSGSTRSSEESFSEAHLYGWMTLENVSETLGVSVEVLLSAGSLPDDFPRDVPLKDIDGVDDEELLRRLTSVLEAETKEYPENIPSNPDEIKARLTISQIAEAFGLESGDILREAGWPIDSGLNTSIKTLSEELGKSPDDIREAVKKLSE